MEDNESEARLQRIEKLLQDQSNTSNKLLRIASILVIPVVGTALTYFVGDGANKIAKGQLELSRAQVRVAESEIDLRILELFKDIIGDPAQRPKAEGLINLMNSRIAQIARVAVLVEQGDSAEQELLITAIDNRLIEIINAYEIGIFYNPQREGQREEAEEIKRKLVEVGVNSSIQVSPQRDTASSNQIRYFRTTEEDVALALQATLQRVYPEQRFNLQTVYTESKGYVSIFLET